MLNFFLLFRSRSWRNFSAISVSFSMPRNGAIDRSEGSPLLVSIYYMHTVSSKKKKKYILSIPFENFKSNQYLRWWKPLCQTKLQLCFQSFPLCTWHMLKMIIFMWQNGTNTRDCLQKRQFPSTYSKGRRDRCVGTPVTHSGTEGRLLYSRIYVVFGEKRSPWINDSFLMLCH